MLTLAKDPRNLIVDTASPGNLILKSAIDDERQIITTNTKAIEGICPGQIIQTLGEISGVYFSHRSNLSFIFDVIQDEAISFPKGIHGLIGLKSMANSEILIAQKKLRMSNKISFPLLTFTDSKEVKETISPADKNIDETENPIFIANDKEKLKHAFVFAMTHISSETNHDLPQRVDIILTALKLSHIENDARTKLIRLIEHFNKIFFIEGDLLTKTNLIEHNIVTKDEKPIFVRQYRIPEYLREELEKQVDEMLHSGVVQICKSSPYNAPVFLVPKKSIDGNVRHRLVVNFQNLNAALIPDRFPTPLIDDILYRLSKSPHFTVLDLKSSYFQVPIKPECRFKTAFSLNSRKLCFCSMPQGLLDSGATLQRLLNLLLEDLIGKTVYVYVDDIIVMGKDTETHLKNLYEVFNRLMSANLKIEPSKCEFLKDEVEYLGHIVKKSGILPNEAKIRVVRDFPPPETVKQLKGFLGLTSYYRKFIENYAEIAYPMNQLLKKNSTFKWSTTVNEAFNKLKEKLISPPLLAYPDFEKPFLIATDASNFSIGTVLSQIGSDNLDHPIGFASRSLNPAESQYSCFDREFLAIVWAVTTQWRPFIQGRNFTVFTDHLPLVTILTSRLDNGTSRIVRWKARLLEFSFKIVYRRGKINNVADFLSRLDHSKADGALMIEKRDEKILRKIESDEIISDNNQTTFFITRNTKTREEFEIMTQYLEFVDDIKGKVSLKPAKFVSESDNKISYADDNSLKVLFLTKDQRNLPSEIRSKFDNKIFRLNEVISDKNIFAIIFKESIDDATDEKSLFLNVSRLRESLILRREKIIHFKALNEDLKIPHFVFVQMISFIFRKDLFKIIIFKDQSREIFSEQEQKELINQFHTSLISGHAGVTATYNRMRRFYTWPKMKLTIKQAIRICPECQLNKTTIKPNIPLKVTTTSKQPFDKVAIDLVGPLPETLTGSKYLFTILDDLTRYLLAIPIPNMEAQTVATELVNKFFSVYGASRSLLSDNGTNFISELFRETCRIFKIKKLYTTPYRPQGNYVERSHRDIKTYLRIFVNENKDNWDALMPMYVFKYNTSKHSSTGYTPYELVFGREAKLPFQDRDNLPSPYTYDDYANHLKFNLQKMAYDAREQAIKEKEKRVIKFNINTKKFECKVGDLVKLKSNMNPIGGKLNPIWSGPHSIVEINSDEYLTILVKNKKKKYHKNMVAPYYTTETNENENITSDEEIE